MNNKIFIIEDERDLAELLESIFLREEFEVYKFYSGKQAINEIKYNKPDIILMDLMLPDLSGLQLCNEIKEIEGAAEIPIVVLTARYDEYDILNAFSFGCADYITKPFNEKILVARIKACLLYKTNKYLNENVKEKNKIKFENLEILPESYEVKINNKPVEFTALEFKLFYLLAKNHGKVYKRDQIFEEIYEDYYNRSDRSIDILVNRLRKKLGEYGSWIDTVYGVGYSFKSE